MTHRTLLRSGLAGLVLIVVLLTPIIALAGGVSVALDKPPGDVEAGKLLTIGFLIRSAHEDRTPQPGLKPLIKASSLTTDEQVTAIAQAQGDAGHYVANLTFPSAGTWHWQIAPFAEEDSYTLELPGPLEVHTAGAKVAPVVAGIQRDVKALDSAFDARTLTIPAGTTVAWRNASKLPHTVKADNGMFASGNLEAGDSYSFTFAKPGTYAYYCEYHGSAAQGMAGTITVLAAAQPAGVAAVQLGSAAQPPVTLPVTGAADARSGVIILMVALIVVGLGLTLRWRRGRAAR